MSKNSLSELNVNDLRRILSDLPTKDQLGIPEEVLEVAGEITDASDVIGVETGRLEILCRFLFCVAKLQLHS